MSLTVLRLSWLIGLLGISALVAAAPIVPERSRIRSHSHELPLSFEANQGQTDARVDFLARGENYTLFLTATEAVFALSLDAPQSSRAVVRMQLVNSARAAQGRGLEKLAGKVNYLSGNNSEHWRTNVPIYKSVKYTQVYTGIDLIYYGRSRQLEYDFIVSPHADLSAIRLAFAGVDDITVDARGDLVLKTAGEPLRFHKPVLYQLKDGRRTTVEGAYARIAPHAIGFRVGAYDRTRPLIIDPVLSYSTHIGGSADDSGEGIAVDPLGAAYVTGYTFSTDFPTVNALQPTHEGFQRDAFVAKLTPNGKALVYATYVGGREDDVASAIAVDRAGAAYITGFTDSPDFPGVRALPARFCHPGEGATSRDIFVAKLAADGSRLVYSTCLGGDREDFGRAIAVDGSGAAHVGGLTFSCNFPTKNAFAAACHNPGTDDLEAFVAKLTPHGSALTYSTYFGGSGPEGVTGIAVGRDGAVYIAGFTGSPDFPILHPVQPVLRQSEDSDAFVAKFAPDGKSLLYSTHLGGSAGDGAEGIAIDEDGAAYVAINTGSSDFPTVNALQPSYGGSLDAFVAKLPPEGGSLIYATYLGGSGRDEAFGIAADDLGAAYVTGWTFSSDFPGTIVGPGNEGDAFATKLGANGASLAYATRLGGSSTDAGVAIAVDLAGAAYVTGFTYSADFPTKQPLQTPGSSGIITDAFITKFAGDKRRVTIDIKPGTYPNVINVKSHGVIAVAVLSSASFDATAIAPLSVRFGPDDAHEAHGKGHIEDVNSDGRSDLVLHFRTDETGIQCGDAFASLSGRTKAGRLIAGAGKIVTVGCKGR